MTQYFTRFQETGDIVTANAVGWTSISAALQYWPKIGTPAYMRTFMDFQSANSGSINRMLVWDRITADANRANIHQAVLFSYDGTTADEVRLLGRVAGSPSPTDFYIARLTKATGAIEIGRLVASAYTTIATGSVSLAAATNYVMEFRINGIDLSVRVWDYALGSTGRPTTWDLTTTDSNITAAGYCGMHFKAASAGKAGDPNFFSVGTNGDDVFIPMSNAEFSAALKDQTAKWIFLAEFGFTRYDSTGGSASPSVYNPTGKVYISKGGFTSKAYDSPANQLFRDCIKKVPTFSKRMSAQMSGRVEVTFGAMDVENPKGVVTNDRAFAIMPPTSGAFYSSPDSAAASVPGNIFIACEVALDNWNVSSAKVFVAKYTAGQASYIFFIEAGGFLRWFASADGVNNTDAGLSATVATGLAPGRHWVGIFKNSTTGEIRFYTSENGSKWTQLGNPVAGVAFSIFDGTAGLEIGTYSGGTAGFGATTAQIYRMTISSAMNGAALVDFNPASYRSGNAFISATGETWTKNGTASIALADVATGIRDYWTRMCFDRDDYRLEIGGEGWSRWNFRPLIVGRIGDPTAPESDILRFQVRGLDDILQGDLNPDVFTSGPALGMREPRLFGGFENTHGRLEPVLVDSATSKYEISRNAINASSGHAFENNVDLAFNNGLAVSAVNTVTGEITFPSAHGLAVDSRLYWIASPPLGMSVGVEYWVRSGLFTSAKITLATTRGGAAITGGAGTLGGTFTGLNYYFTVTGPSYVTLTVAPAATSRITVDGVYEDNGYGGNEATLNALLQSIIFSTMGVSLNYKDTAYFTPPAFNANLIGYYAGPKPVSAIAALNEIAIGMTCWVMQDVDGMFRWAMVDLPSATPRRYLGGSEILADAMTLETVIRKVDFSKASFSYAPWFLNGGPIQGSTPQLQFGKEFLSYTWPVAFFPMDDYPPWVDMDASKRFDSYYSGSAGAPTHRTRLLGIYKKKSGIFKVPAAMPAIEWNIGETVQIDHDRLDWKNFSASNPSSPDNSSSFDARNAIIVGLDIDPDSDEPFAQMIRLWRPIPAYFPTDAILENPS